MQIDGQNWELQYSPYGYYHEHCIVFNDAHVPMKVDHAIFEKLFDVLDFLPHYFIGSNADLPIVGGSILSHEHFQGGHYTFPMAVAPIEIPVSLAAYPNVQAGILKWPMSVVRLSSTNRKELSDACITAMQPLESMRKPMERHTIRLHRLLGKKAMLMNAIWFCGITEHQKTVRLVFSIQIHPCTTSRKRISA